MGYRVHRGHKEVDMTEQLTVSLYFSVLQSSQR